MAQTLQFLKGQRTSQTAGIECDTAVNDDTRQSRRGGFSVMGPGKADDHKLAGNVDPASSRNVTGQRAASGRSKDQSNVHQGIGNVGDIDTLLRIVYRDFEAVNVQSHFFPDIP